MPPETNSRSNKLHKKVKLSIGRSKNSKDGVETLDFKRKIYRGNKNAQSRTIKEDDVSYADDKLYKRENSGKRSTKSKTKNERVYTGREGYEAVKRKRIYADRDMGKGRTLHNNVETPNGKGLSKAVWNKLKDDFVKEKRTTKGESHNFEQSSRKKSSIGGRRSDGNESLDEKGGKNLRARVKTIGKITNVELDGSDLSKAVRNKLKDDFVKEKRTIKGEFHKFEQSSRKQSAIGGRRSDGNESLDKKYGKILRTRVNNRDKIKNGELDGNGDGMLKKGAKNKSNLSKQLDQNLKKRAAESIEKSAKRKVQDKKSLVDDSVVTDDRPKKKKRVIRIDPHDITNKRLDDGIATNESTKEKKEDLEKNKHVEMSQNAQFRAIQPSPSILSFVEDNLLGRRRLIELKRAGYNTELSAPLDNLPLSTSSERERIKETVFRNKLTFFAAAKISSSFPPPDLPEIAFAGRSNVGKSSLLNSLTRQWGVVRTSDKPGLTQTINFFKLGSKLCLVDLPGYGFAYAKEEVKEAWEDLVKEYVSTRVGLKQVCLLIDTKWGMKPRDHELIDLMERSQTKYQIVLTKTDLVFPIDVARRAMQIEESLKAKKSAVQPVMMVSSKSGGGIWTLRTVLAKITRFAKL